MNLLDLQEICYRHLGLAVSSPGSSSIPLWRVQEVRDAINATIEEIAASSPFLWNLVREGTVSLVAGTSVYYLNDWCRRPLMLWTEDSSAHKVRFTNYRMSSRDGSRNSNATYGTLGPWELTWYPRNTDAVLSGAAASATEDATSITGLAGLTDAMIGRMIRLNGEENDYRIVSHTTTACVVDRKVKARVSGVSTTTSGGYSSVKWEIGPPGRYRFTIRPTPNVAGTLYYSYVALPRKLINANETPEIPDMFHHLIWKGAVSKVALFDKDQTTYGLFQPEYQAGLESLRQQDQDDADVEDGPHYESSLRTDPRMLPQDVYYRGES